jgi:hypothetical protein
LRFRDAADLDKPIGNIFYQSPMSASAVMCRNWYFTYL